MPRTAAKRLEALRAAVRNPEAHLTELARFIVHEAIPEHPRGFTLDPFLFTFLRSRPRSIYMVADTFHERRTLGFPSVEDVLDWLWLRFGSLARPDTWVGGWPNRPFYCLDVSFPIRGEALAREVGLANVQEALYEPATGKEIRLMPVAGSRILETKSTPRLRARAQ